VRLDTRPGDDPVAGVDRPDHLYVVLMQRTDEGVVADEHVAVAHVQMGFAVDVPDHGAGNGRLKRHLESHRHD
jgi:hypothetical protein